MTKADEIVNRLKELTTFIEDAQERLKKGEILNLSHLDGDVAELCEQTLQLSPVDAGRVQPIMGSMITKLEELGLALKDFQSHLKNKVK